MMVCSVAFACTIISLLEKTLCFLFKGGTQEGMSVPFVSAQNEPCKNECLAFCPLGSKHCRQRTNLSHYLLSKTLEEDACLSVRLCLNKTGMRRCSKVAGKHWMFVFSASDSNQDEKIRCSVGTLAQKQQAYNTFLLQFLLKILRKG
jgi:hypothetical protein